jgi:T4 bacteriophage base plate protein
MSQPIKEKPDQGIFLLPGGYISSDGTCHQLVKLRQLTGREEEMIVDTDAVNDNVITLLTRILASCIESIGPIKEISLDVVRQLLICDRDYLLLKLRQMTFGDRIDAQVKCPNESCGKLMHIDFDLKKIKVQRKNIGKGFHSIHLSPLASYKDSNNVKHTEIDFRLPIVADQEEISEQLYRQTKNESKALTKLLQRCLMRIGNINEIDEDMIYSLSILARREIDQKMQELSPKVDLRIHFKCPVCGNGFTSPFDLQNFFLAK